MESYRSYATQVEQLVRELSSQRKASGHLDVRAALDGEPSRALRAAVPLQTLRSSGAFFSSRVLGNVIAHIVAETADRESVFFDPACGAGELLLASARLLGAEKNLEETLIRWATQLLGVDLHPEFVRVCRARLVLEAMSQCGVTGDLAPLAELLPNIRVKDGLTSRAFLKKTTHVIMNPPFTVRPILEQFDWATGNVSMAAMFLSHCVQHAGDGTHVVAVLPEVLRTGERYKHWRAHVEEYASIRRVRRYGQFDKYTDVDVFVAALVVGAGKGRSSPWWRTAGSRAETVSDYFDVSVGPVVPFRDKKVGVRAPFLNARSAARWLTVWRVPTFRKYSGRLHRPPFVVIRRTSRPDDNHRAIGTIIRGSEPIAVENHLLVARPKDRRVSTCEALLRVLIRPETTKWFNERIRCRHITAAALKDLPWWTESTLT